MVDIPDRIGILARTSGVRFALVGGACFLLDEAILILLHGVAGLWLSLASALAYGAAFLANFLLNRIWVFSATGGGAVRHFARYVCLVLVNLGLTVVLVPWISKLGLDYRYAKAVVTASLFVMNYLVSRRWIYTTPAARPDRTEVKASP
ncbi:GtrA family protein [Longispora sp. NPDC051575]|uniref:GtrA family protein n=1 Tax=Longispora sp. NPDC051575 TaxID=3154943 RepID=UPI0034225BAF